MSCHEKQCHEKHPGFSTASTKLVLVVPPFTCLHDKMLINYCEAGVHLLIVQILFIHILDHLSDVFIAHVHIAMTMKIVECSLNSIVFYLLAGFCDFQDLGNNLRYVPLY